MRCRLFNVFLNYISLLLNAIIIISGDKGSGKSTFLIEILSLLQTEGFAVKGFVALKNYECDSYTIKNVATHEEALLLQRVSGFEKFPDHFKIFPEGVEKGLDWIEEILEQSPGIAVIDEIGGYELQGMLWSNGFTRLVESGIPLIFTVKTKHLNKVVRKWNISGPIIFDAHDFGNPRTAFEKVKEWIESTPK